MPFFQKFKKTLQVAIAEAKKQAAQTPTTGMSRGFIPPTSQAPTTPVVGKHSVEVILPIRQTPIPQISGGKGLSVYNAVLNERRIVDAVIGAAASSIVNAFNAIFAGGWDDDEPMSSNWYSYGAKNFTNGSISKPVPVPVPPKTSRAGNTYYTTRPLTPCEECCLDKFHLPNILGGGVSPLEPLYSACVLDCQFNSGRISGCADEEKPSDCDRCCSGYSFPFDLMPHGMCMAACEHGDYSWCTGQEQPVVPGEIPLLPPTGMLLGHVAEQPLNCPPGVDAFVVLVMGYGPYEVECGFSTGDVYVYRTLCIPPATSPYTCGEVGFCEPGQSSVTYSRVVARGGILVFSSWCMDSPQ